jgi:hypothetical protein
MLPVLNTPRALHSWYILSQGEEADKELKDTFCQADSLIRTSSALAVDNETSAHVQTPATRSRLMARKQVGKGTPYVSQAPDDAMEEDKDSVENLSDYYNEELVINEGEESFGHDAHGTSPLADDCHRATNRAGMNGGIHQERAGAIPLQASVTPLLI